MNIASTLLFGLAAIGLAAIGTLLITRTTRFVRAFFGESAALGVKEWSIKAAGVGAICIGIVFAIAFVAAVTDILSGA